MTRKSKNSLFFKVFGNAIFAHTVCSKKHMFLNFLIRSGIIFSNAQNMFPS